MKSFQMSIQSIATEQINIEPVMHEEVFMIGSDNSTSFGN